MQGVNFVHLSWQDVEDSCVNIYNRILEDNIEINAILALFRGGVVPGRIFADLFDVVFDFYGMDAKFYTGINSTMEKVKIRPSSDIDVSGKKLLIVDDIWDSGRTMEAALIELETKLTEHIVTATLVWKVTAKGQPSYFDKIADNEWIIFPWEKREFTRGDN